MQHEDSPFGASFWGKASHFGDQNLGSQDEHHGYQ